MVGVPAANQPRNVHINNDIPSYGVSTASLLFIDSKLDDIKKRKKVCRWLSKMTDTVSKISKIEDKGLAHHLWGLYWEDKRINLAQSFKGEDQWIHNSICNHVNAMVRHFMKDCFT